MMNRITLISTLISGGAIVLCPSGLQGRTFSAEYTAEWQTDFKGGYDWLNLLKTSAEAGICSGVTAQVSTISTAKTGDGSLIDDLLTYSNIEAGNIPLTFARLGFALSLWNSQLFVGISNVNEDYFTSELTSFFTNSSCGISPTISCNYDIANYPVAAWCVHYLKELGDFSLQTSLYPGRGYSRLLGHDNLFSLNFRHDGIFSISSIQYNRNGIYSVMGVALHYGVCAGDEDGEPEQTPPSPSKKRFSASPWLLTEIGLPCNLGLLFHGSLSTVRTGCKAYAGVGMVYSGAPVMPGISFNYASFTSEKEYDLEVSVHIPLLSGTAGLQPAMHLVCTDGGHHHAIGMLRLYVNI